MSVTDGTHGDHQASEGPTAPAARPEFYSIADAAHLLGMSHMTLRRAINSGQFPAVRFRGRVLIPAGAIAELTARAYDGVRPARSATVHPARGA